MNYSTNPVSMSTPPKKKLITVHYLPGIGAPQETHEGTSIGCRVDASDAGHPIGYRVWNGTKTSLYPAGNVLRIDLDL